jgi:prolyl oligopeptidase
VPEHESDVLSTAVYVKDSLVCTYMHNATEKVVVCSISEEKVRQKVLGDAAPLMSWETALPGPGSIPSVSGRYDDEEFFFSFVSFIDPGSIWRCDSTSRVTTRAFFTELGNDAPNTDLCGTHQTWYESTDGTRIPMFIVGRKEVLQRYLNPEDASSPQHPCPTLLYGYGGFNISLTPSFSVSRLIFMYYMNGVICIPSLRHQMFSFV